jgi:hypothetical protein
MSRSLQRCVAALLLVFFISALVSFPHPVRAQFSDDDQEGDIGVEPDDEFTDAAGADEAGMSGERDLTDGETYNEESPTQVGAGVAGSRQLQTRFAEERQALPSNAAWGAGTGLLIGGWLALIAAGSNRDTQRSIGTGIVLGALIGVAVGVRFVVNPGQPAVGQAAEPASQSSLTPLVSLDDSSVALGLRFVF